MKNLQTLEEVKAFSIALKKSLENNKVEVKQSLILESIAKSLDLKDWNTLSAALKEGELAFNPTHTEKIYMEIKYASGFFLFEYDEHSNKLKITDKVGSDCTNSHIFTVSIMELNKMGECLLANQNSIKSNEKNILEYKSGSKINLICDNNNCVTLMLNSPHSSLAFNNLSLKNQKDFINFFRKITKNEKLVNVDNFIYPLKNGLLHSMAMRSDHSFGLWEDKEQIDNLLDKMAQLYKLYDKGLSDDQIANQTNYSSVKIKQLREEVNGTGFYNPTPEKKLSY